MHHEIFVAAVFCTATNINARKSSGKVLSGLSMPKFTVKTGAQPGLEIAMEGNRLVFGRADDCDVVVADNNVSRRHAQAVLLNDLISLMDLNSSNGTYVNELPISRVFLMDGDEVRIGETVLVYSDDSEARVNLYDRASTAKSSDGEVPRFSREPAIEQIDQTQLFAPLQDDSAGDALKDIYLKLKTLYRVFHEVAQAQSLKEIFEVVGRALTVGIAAERVIFFLSAEKAGSDWQRFFVHTAARLAPQSVTRQESDVILGRARDQRHTVVAAIHDSQIEENAEPNTVAVPLIRAGAVYGIMYVDNPESGVVFQKNDVDFISTLALQISVRLNQFEQVQQLRQENVQLRRKVDEEHAIIVQNEKMKQILAITARVGESESCVLITGESGTGKELIARAIHNFSRRSSKPLVAVNCAALPDTLLESELFGHEKGAFTGAVERRIGKFELADNGTLFLDEIGDISAAAQAKLLRALQEGEIQRVGGNKTIKVNVRLIAATNKDLAAEVQKANFRQDLYFRIRVIELKLPPLRERKDDIPALAEYFLKQLRQKFPTPVRSVSPEALDALAKYNYPGNVRELRNIIERGMVFATGDAMLPEHLPIEVFQDIQLTTEGQPVPPSVTSEGQPLSLAEVEKAHIQNVLKFVKGNKLRAASFLGISRTTLYEKLKAYGLGTNSGD
jgi:transcriptional regulator with GAF, ATPase, and Fis domain